MSRSFFELFVHVVWSTKNREAMIKEELEIPFI